ncbi:MAG: hypothetical protein ACKOB9_04865 [Solirubrobacterales bacterium]
MEAGAEIVVIEAEAAGPSGGLFGAITGAVTGAVGAAARTGAQVTMRATEGAVEAVMGSKAVQDSIERVVASPAMTGAVDAVVGSPAVQQTLERVVSGPAFASALRTILSPETVDMIADEVVRSQMIQKITVTAMEAGEMAPIVDAFLEREELWILVQTIAESPAVIDAVRQQGFGFADQVGDEVRGRSRTADQVVARTARTFIGRSEKLDAQLPTDQEEHSTGKGSREEHGDKGASS